MNKNICGLLPSKQVFRFRVAFRSECLSQDDTDALALQVVAVSTGERMIRDFVNDETRMDDMLDITFQDDIEGKAIEAAYTTFYDHNTELQVVVDQLDGSDNVLTSWLYTTEPHRIDHGTLTYGSSAPATFTLALIVKAWSLKFKGEGQ